MKKVLNVNRFMQDPSHCAVAASASYVNYFNNEIDYEFVKPVAYEINKNIKNGSGMEDPEIGILLNIFGFKKVDVINADLNYLDFSWGSLSKNDLIEIFEKESKRKLWKESGHNDTFKSFVKFLRMDGYLNRLIIDNNFGERIRESIDNNTPPIITFNWTSLFKGIKRNKKKEDPIYGDSEEHAVVVNGYDKKGVYIIDSHHQCYKYSLKEYKDGKYFIPWENLMIAMGMTGSIVIGYEYSKKKLQYELV